MKASTPIRVTHIASGDLWAGAEKQLFVLLTALAKRADVVVDAVVLNPGELGSRLHHAGIATLVLDEASTTSLALHRRILHHLRSTEPDLVHTHRIKENILGALAAWRAGIPSLRTQHGASEHGVSFLDARRAAMNYLDSILARFVQRRIVAVSDALGEELQRHSRKSRIAVIPNGIETVPANPGPDLRWEGPMRWRIGIVGRLVPVKRIDVFLQLAEWLTRHIAPSMAPEFMVIGEGPLRRELEERASDFNDASVTFVGHVPDPQPLIAGLHAMVICSDHEGLPMVALEAMLAGTVVVARGIGGLPTLLDHGRCGVLVDSQSPEAFGRALIDLMNDPSCARELGLRARVRVAERYSAKAMAQGYFKLYATLLKEA